MSNGGSFPEQSTEGSSEPSPQPLILPWVEEEPEDDPNVKYAYDQLGSKGKRVGQAVLDVLAKDQPAQTAGDTLEAYGPDYAKQIEQCVQENQHKYKEAFYILVLSNKEMWATNVIRNWFIARQTPPHAFQLMEQYPNHTKTLYLVDAQKGRIEVVWCLPGWQDCLTIAKRPAIHNQQLVRWIEQCFSRKLNLDAYTFDWILKNQV